eukprot:2069248-Rhodomonas_salina.1
MLVGFSKFRTNLKCTSGTRVPDPLPRYTGTRFRPRGHIGFKSNKPPRGLANFQPTASRNMPASVQALYHRDSTAARATLSRC